ncbi:MAG TPA: hypothetical protein VLZ74_09740 [Methylocella sp.]|nr:hypothetical protein [Methylocella sp.]
MKRLVDIAAALLLGSLVGTAVSAFMMREEPHSAIINVHIKPIAPNGQRI